MEGIPASPVCPWLNGGEKEAARVGRSHEKEGWPWQGRSRCFPEVEGKATGKRSGWQLALQPCWGCGALRRGEG